MRITIDNKLLLGVAVVTVLMLLSVRSLTKANSKSQNLNKTSLTPTDSFTHSHGMVVDSQNPDKLYIATHHGLYMLLKDKELFKVGESQDDFMGFSYHPTDSNIFFSSGHPESGGNIGFQKSKDGGISWKKISDGINGPVDFHAMTVSPADPQLIYGWYQGGLQKSEDEGKTWEIVGETPFVVVGLTADIKDENILYAASPQGAFISSNQGRDWQPLSDQLDNTFVTVIAQSPDNPDNLLSFSESLKLAKSSDGGKSWNKIKEDFFGESVLYLSFNKKNSDIVYALTGKNSIYKSLNNGELWSKIF